MRVISTDGIGLAAMVRAAEKLSEVIDEFGVDLGVIDDPALGKAIAIAPRGGDWKLLVTVERNPKIVERPEADDGRSHVERGHE